MHMITSSALLLPFDKFAMTIIGMLGCYQCVVTYTDAGKACQDSSDCQGKCKNTGEFLDANAKTQSGQCASDSSPFGCYQAIEEGVTQPAICVD